MKEKKIAIGTIITNQPIAAGIYQIEISSAEVALSAKAGQFVNVYLNNPSKLLPRPISVCKVSGDTITLVYGAVGDGTRELATYEEGKELRVSTAMGNGYDLSEITTGDTVMAVGGGIGVPPLLQLTLAVKKLGAKVIAVVGYRDEPFLIDELKQAGAEIYVATDSGNEGFRGTVVQLIEERALAADHYFACGPKVMLRFLTAFLAAQDQDVQVSMEERMGCGFGACVGCVCDVRDSQSGTVIRKKVCKDGPVFLGSEVIWDGR